MVDNKQLWTSDGNEEEEPSARAGNERDKKISTAGSGCSKDSAAHFTLGMPKRRSERVAKREAILAQTGQDLARISREIREKYL